MPAKTRRRLPRSAHDRTPVNPARHRVGPLLTTYAAAAFCAYPRSTIICRVRDTTNSAFARQRSASRALVSSVPSKPCMHSTFMPFVPRGSAMVPPRLWFRVADFFREDGIRAVCISTKDLQLFEARCPLCTHTGRSVACRNNWRVTHGPAEEHGLQGPRTARRRDAAPVGVFLETVKLRGRNGWTAELTGGGSTTGGWRELRHGGRQEAGGDGQKATERTATLLQLRTLAGHGGTRPGLRRRKNKRQAMGSAAGTPQPAPGGMRAALCG